MSQASHVLMLFLSLAPCLSAADPAPSPAPPAPTGKFSTVPKYPAKAAIQTEAARPTMPDTGTEKPRAGKQKDESQFLRIRRRLEESRARAAGKPVRRVKPVTRKPARPTKPSPSDPGTPAPTPPTKTSKPKLLTRTEVRDQERIDAERERLFKVLFPED